MGAAGAQMGQILELSFILFAPAEFFDGFEEFRGYAEDALVAIFQFNGTFQ